MAKRNYYLITGGVLSAFISIFHVVLVFNPTLFSYVTPGQSALTEMALQGSSITTVASIALALLFAIWALYAFSGAGMIRRLPLLRAALIIIGIIYILRSLFLPSEIKMVLTQAYPLQFVIFSLISLVTGLFYIIGVLKQRTILADSK